MRAAVPVRSLPSRMRRTISAAEQQQRLADVGIVQSEPPRAAVRAFRVSLARKASRLGMV
jgi:hypothetical protein